MNFIEAALLIQGSACIYSKKVRRALVANLGLGRTEERQPHEGSHGKKKEQKSMKRCFTSVGFAEGVLLVACIHQDSGS